mgnify:CR=1 FL=1
MPAPSSAKPLYRIDECPDLMADGCVGDEQGNLVFLSIWARDTAVQEFLARLTLSRSQQGLDQFHLVTDQASIPVFVGNVENLEKRTTRAFRRTLFGSLSNVWLFDRRWSGGVSLSLEHANVANVLQDILYPDADDDAAGAAPDPYPSYEAWQDAIDAGETIPSQYLMEYALWDLSLGFTTGYRHFTPLGWLGVSSGISTSLERVSYDEEVYRPFDATLREIKKKIANANIESDPMLGIAFGRELHRAIMDAAHNGIMADIGGRLENLTVLTANITKRAPAIEKASADAHLNIINALLQQDEEKSEQLMREHLRETCRHVVEQFYPGMLETSSSNK